MGAYVGELAEEMGGAEFGDERLSRRLKLIVAAVSHKPDEGFPAVLGDEASTEAFYRFLRNGKVTPEAILKPHIEATAKRCEDLSSYVVVHDTTTFSFGGEAKRPGLGHVTDGGHGFLGHFALAVDHRSANRPLGLLGLKTWVRTTPKGARRGRREYLQRLRQDPTKESLRWGELVETVEDVVTERRRAIHVMDRESDNYALLARMHAIGARFVVRMAKHRKLFPLGPDEPVPGEHEEWSDLPDVLEREVELSARRKTEPPDRHHPPRGCRTATLRIAAKRSRVKRGTAHPYRLPIAIELNAVRVYEVDAPEGQEPVEWLLLTTEPIDTVADVARVVDIYRARWVIEEFFKALKQGCAVEARQLESYETLTNALAILAPIAWKILLLRNVHREKTRADLADVATTDQIEVLREFSSRPPPRHPTVADVTDAIAGLGGHLKNNGPPGWLVLWRGYRELLTLERAWSAAKKRMGCDQS